MNRLAPCVAVLCLLGPRTEAQNLLVNPGAEAGSLQGWTIVNGMAYEVTPNVVHAGGFSFHPGPDGPVGSWSQSIEQVVDLTPWAAAIDGTALVLPVRCFAYSTSVPGSTDWASVALELLDGSGTPLLALSENQVSPVNIWNLVSFEPTLPTGTRSARITLTGNRSVGLSTNCYFDSLRCEYPRGPVGSGFCFGTSCPCGNDEPLAGCLHQGGEGARLVTSGSASVAADDLSFHGFGLPANTWSVLVMGTGSVPAFPFADGRLCLAGPLVRLDLVQSDSSGRVDFLGGHGAQAGWNAGELRTFQGWYRDPFGPCGAGSNLTSGLRVDLLP